jgi:hypothetical protein
MNNTMSIGIALDGPDHPAILRAIHQTGLFGTGLPDSLEVKGKELARVPKDWLDKYAGSDMVAVWGNFDFMLSNSLGEMPKVHARSFPRSTAPLLELLSGLPFTVASFNSIHPDWLDGSYNAPGFGGLHFPHGVACGFKGAGHRQLVSRRWLDFGPWRKLRGADDTTLVQFHDLFADSATALAQARPGHVRMGVTDEGGFIAHDHEYQSELSGYYYPDQRRQRIMAALREVPQLEMLDACAARLYQKWGADRPTEHVGFLFLEEQLARRHLHELWLRELECWTIIGGKEVRIDEDYQAKTDSHFKWGGSGIDLT